MPWNGINHETLLAYLHLQFYIINRWLIFLLDATKRFDACVLTPKIEFSLLRHPMSADKIACTFKHSVGYFAIGIGVVIVNHPPAKTHIVFIFHDIFHGIA